MRVAVFAPYFPAPAFTGGRIRIQHLAHALARVAELHLFAQARAAEASDPRALAEASVYHAVHAVAAGPTLPVPLNLGRPQRVRRGSPGRLARRFAAQHASTPYDLIVVEHSHAAAAALHGSVPWLLDEHNIESDYLASKLAAGGALRPWHRPELRRMRAWERACWQRASAVVAVTQADAELISAERDQPAAHIPNGVNLSQLAYTPPAARSGATVLFVGLMDHPPNVQAAVTLATQIMPLVWTKHPHAQLLLCGANPARAVLQLAGPRITVTGRVPTLAPYLAQARVFANALVFGAGSSLKVLEALAAGLPLISTRSGVRGFALAPEQSYLAAETPAEFASAIVRCLEAPTRDPAFEQRAALGRSFAEGHDWPRLAEQFAALAVRTAQGRRDAS